MWSYGRIVESPRLMPRLTSRPGRRRMEVSPSGTQSCRDSGGNIWPVNPGDTSQGELMAKALYGHVGSMPDRRVLDEVTRLRAQVRALEFEVARLRAENDRLSAAVSSGELLRVGEPALT